MPGLEGTTLAGRYRIERVLGSGGMGEVHEGTDVVLKRRVAIKLMLEGLEEDAISVERFEREARSAASLSHPNAVLVYDSGTHEGRHYIVMELLTGPTLKETLAREGRLEVSHALGIADSVLSVLEVAHIGGLIHRDIKPSNIVITATGGVKVTDFGLARPITDLTLTRTGQALGSTPYVSPEQARGLPLGPATDIYSLGCVLYESLTGQPPFSGDTDIAVAMQHLEAPVPRPSDIVSTLSPATDDLVTRALAKTPEERFSSATEMREAVAAVLEGRAVAAPEPAQPDRTAVLPGSLAGASAGADAVAHRDRATTTAMIPSGAAASTTSSTMRGRGWATLLIVLGLLAALIAAVVLTRERPDGGPPATPPATTESTPTAGPTVVAPTTPPPTTAPPVAPEVPGAPPLGDAAAVVGQVIADGAASGAVQPNAAQDLMKQVEEVVDKAAEGKVDEAIAKAEEFRDKLDEAVEKGDVASDYAPIIAAAMDGVDLALGALGGGGGDGEGEEEEEED